MEKIKVLIAGNKEASASIIDLLRLTWKGMIKYDTDEYLQMKQKATKATKNYKHRTIWDRVNHGK